MTLIEHPKQQHVYVQVFRIIISKIDYLIDESKLYRYK